MTDEEINATLAAIALSAEQASGTIKEVEKESVQLVNWLQNYRLWPADRSALASLRGQAKFNSLTESLGAVWWPPVLASDTHWPIVAVSRTNAGFSIRVALVCWLESEIQAFAIRFEEPHGDVGKHSFHHAQLCSKLLREDDAPRIIDQKFWIPEEQPSFPLKIDKSGQLLWAVAVAIYGKDRAHSPFLNNPTATRDLAEYVKLLT